MSVLDDVAVSSPAAERTSTTTGRLGGRLVSSELRLVFGRRRNQALLAVLALIPIVIAIAAHASSDGDRAKQSGLTFFGDITGSGVYVALAAMYAVVPLLLPLTVAVVGGDAVAGEAQAGTLRYLLTVPVGRTRLLVTKYAVVAAWCVIAALVLSVAGTVTGLALFPSGDVTLLSGRTVSLAAGIGRLLGGAAYIAVMMAGFGAIALFISTLTESPLAAMAATSGVAIVSEVLDQIGQLGAIHPWLPSHYWLLFPDVMRDPLAFDRLGHALLVVAGQSAVFLALAWARFGGKDVTS